MELSNIQLEEILSQYNIGSLLQFQAPLESGFQSDNFHISTEQGDFVVRIFHDSEMNVRYSQTIYEYLATHGIKTPKPERTKENDLVLLFHRKIVVVQTFLEGTSYEDDDKDTIFGLLPFFGEELGKVHTVSKNMVAELGEEKLTKAVNTITYVRNSAQKYMPKKAYIKSQYQEWEEEIKQLPAFSLTKAVIHGDIGPKDFFFKDGEFTGIIDFNAAVLDFLLFDIAPMMMYCGLYKPQNAKHYAKFVNAYLAESPVQKEEFKWLHTILKTRWLLQVFYHQYRYVEGITQGLETGNVEENLQGVIDGENFLKILEKCSKDYFYEVLDAFN
ncbi:MAG: phosphotransferase [Candidatus Hodarchaeota archaeon]